MPNTKGCGRGYQALGAGSNGRATFQKITLIKVIYYFFFIWQELLRGHSPSAAEQ